MANSTCSITSISDLLDKGDRYLLNVTTTIASCPSICSLAWGNGNPDLSGIGVNVSYIMQAILALLCGPILAVIYFFRNGLRLDERTQDRLSEILNTFVDISAAFNIPVAIAAVIRLHQYAPFFEQYFMLFLVCMQLCSFVAVVCVVPLFEKRHCKGVQKIALYLGIQATLLLVTYILQIKIISRWVTVNELIGSCKSYRQVVPFFVIFQEQVKVVLLISRLCLAEISLFLSKSSKPTLYQLFKWLMVAIIAIPILLGILFGFKVSRRLLLGKTQKRTRGFVVIIAGLNNLTAYCAIIISDLPLTAFIMVLMTVLILGLLWLLQTMRRGLKETSMGNFQDDYWGLGQIIAVFLWVPLCLQIIYYTMCLA